MLCACSPSQSDPRTLVSQHRPALSAPVHFLLGLVGAHEQAVPETNMGWNCIYQLNDQRYLLTISTLETFQVFLQSEYMKTGLMFSATARLVQVSNRYCCVSVVDLQ